MGNKNNISHINIEYIKEITKDCYTVKLCDNLFCVFNSIDNILNLIYLNNQTNIIISYNLITNQKINEIRNTQGNIKGLKYQLDVINKRDLLMSISTDRKILIWDIKNFECVLKLKNLNKFDWNNSGCFLNYNNQIYIIQGSNSKESIKVFDLNGNKIKQIKENNSKKDAIIFIDIYKDNKNFNIYIIIGYEGYVKSFDYNKSKLYFKYFKYHYIDLINREHGSVIVLNSKNKTILIESCFSGYILLWDFHSGKHIKLINIYNNNINTINEDTSIYGICLLNNNYLFVGCSDKSIKLIDLTSGNILKKIEGHNNQVINVRTFFHPTYGKCLISLGLHEDQIKLWKIKD